MIKLTQVRGNYMFPKVAIQEYLSALIDYAPNADKELQRRIFEDMRVADGLLNGNRALTEAEIVNFYRNLKEWEA